MLEVGAVLLILAILEVRQVVLVAQAEVEPEVRVDPDLEPLSLVEAEVAMMPGVVLVLSLLLM